MELSHSSFQTGRLDFLVRLGEDAAGGGGGRCEVGRYPLNSDRARELVPGAPLTSVCESPLNFVLKLPTNAHICVLCRGLSLSVCLFALTFSYTALAVTRG